MAFPKSYYAQAIIVFAVVGLAYVVAYLSSSGDTLVTDAMGWFGILEALLRRKRRSPSLR